MLSVLLLLLLLSSLRSCRLLLFGVLGAGCWRCFALA
jgi:hypothetical protein